MNNILYNYFNKPTEYKTGQIWHCNKIGEDIVISSINDVYIKRGIIRGMILTNEVYLGDKNDLKFKTTGMLNEVFSNELVLLRITEGPLHVDDLSFYLGEIPDNIRKKIPKVFKYPLRLDPVQKEFSSDYLDKLKPLWDNAFEKDELYLENLNKLKVLIVLNKLVKNAIRIQYGVVAADGSESAIFDEFWNKERQNRKNSVILLEDNNSFLSLTTIDGRLYFTAQSNKFKKISDVKLIQKKAEIPAVDELLKFGKEDRVFTSFSDKKKLKEGDCVIVLKIDGKDFKFTFQIK